MNVIYFGYNSFKKFKRGVENVIIFQSLALNFKYRVYIHWGDKNEVYKYNNFICISIKNSIFWPIYLNFIVFKIKNRFKNKTIIHSHSPIFSFFSCFKIVFLIAISSIVSLVITILFFFTIY